MKDCASHDFELFRISRGELAPMLATRAHLLGCPTCRARVAELRNVSVQLTEAISGRVGRQPFGRLSAPLASVVIVAGVFAMGSLAGQVAPMLGTSAQPAAKANSSALECGPVMKVMPLCPKKKSVARKDPPEKGDRVQPIRERR